MIKARVKAFQTRKRFYARRRVTDVAHRAGIARELLHVTAGTWNVSRHSYPRGIIWPGMTHQAREPGMLHTRVFETRIILGRLVFYVVRWRRNRRGMSGEHKNISEQGARPNNRRNSDPISYSLFQPRTHFLFPGGLNRADV